MGLEMVDIILQTEDMFNIEIPDEDMFDIITVGQYCDYVVERLGALKSRKCLSSVIFYRLRRAFIDRLGIQRNDFKSDTCLDDLLPSHSRQRVWADLAESSGLNFPPLVRPEWIMYTITAGTIGFVIAAWVFRSWLITLGAIIFAFAAINLTNPMAVYLRQDAQTVRSAVELLLRMNISKLIEEEHTWSPDDIWKVLVEIITRSLGVDPQEVTREARFIDDLGAG